MLLTDKKRFVELVMDNIMWGNVKIDKHEVEQYTKEDDVKKYLSYMFDFAEDYAEKKDTPEFSSMIIELHSFFTASRFAGGLIGELRDRDEENMIKQLSLDNEKLAERLQEAYIPPTDMKVGTT